MTGVNYDITERKHTEQSLREQRELLQGIFDNIPVMLVLWDPELRRFTLNRHFQQVLGWTDEDANDGRNFMEKVYPDPDRRAEVGAFMQALSPGWKEFEITARNGDVIPTNWSNVRLTDERMIGIGIDLRERKQAEQQLRESEMFSKQILMSSLSGLYIYDLEEGRNVFVNPHYTELTGYTAAEMKAMNGGDFNMLFHPDDKPVIESHLADLRNGRDGEVVEVEYRFRHANGRWIWCYSRDSVFSRAPDGRVKQFIGAFLDVTDDKEKEEQLRRSRDELEERVKDRTAQLRALTAQLTNAEDEERQRLAQILHDDLQQQLAVTKMRISMLRQNLRDKEDGEKAAAELIELVDEAIAKTRHLSRELSPANLRMHGLFYALECLADDMCAKHGLNVKLNLQPDAEPPDPPIASLIFRSVNELLFNVVKHSGETEAVVEARQLDGALHVTVRDNGKGFDAKNLRGKLASCTAFGLMSIEERLTHLGGSMQMDGGLGEGCCVTLMLPVPATPAAETGAAVPHQGRAPSQAQSRNGDGKTVRILLVDDHDVMRESLAALLNGEPDFVIVGQATSGREGIRLTDELGPDVVLMDVSMPEMNGIEATAFIRKSHPGIAVIGLTMHNDTATELQMRHAGATEFLAKSGSAETLVATIRACAKPSPP
jgi:PAS domain S-box-containing protein